ncbi:alpha/beta fold hydrolase [uncultured Clostridium sp.]|uniref:alpha/beta fold hydrolase n=1 Tax=uncultured Clostridium sp. TaxID=59620 RepID=UPI0025D17B23|nr:alpha/beta hydrolase [uncultured Clostridium sp.]
MKYLKFKRSYIDKSEYNGCIFEKYISSENYIEDMSKKTEPFLNNFRESGYILGMNNIRLYYEKFILENDKGSIVICHGIGEYTEKYNELIYYFLNSGYSVFILEHRGNGRSGRIGSDSGQVSIENFNYYIDDFKKFIDEIVVPSSHNNLLLFAHSMGGGIGTLFLERYPEYFHKAVLSSPMHQVHTGKTPPFIADIISAILMCLGRKGEYMISQKPYSGRRKFPGRTTSCKQRYEYQYNKILNNQCFQTGGASIKWYFETAKATRYLRNKRNISKVKIPVLLFQAEYDTHVTSEAQYKFAKYADNCEIVVVKGGKHETFAETDEIAKQVIKKIIDFFWK